MRTHSITFYDLNDPKPEVNRMIQMRLKSSPDKWETYGTWNGKSFRDQNNRLRLDVVEWFYDDEQYPKPDDDAKGSDDTILPAQGAEREGEGPSLL